MLSSAVFYEHLHWWQTLTLSSIGALALIGWAIEYRRVNYYNARELDTWLRVAGDLRQILPAVTEEDKDVPLLSVGPGFTRVLGWEQSEMEGRRWTEFVHPDDLLAEGAGSDRLATEGSFQAYCNRWLHKEPYANGEPRYVWFEWNAITDDELGRTYASGRDITDQFKREGQMATWSRITNDLMAVADTGGDPSEWKFEWLNEAWTRQLGWSIPDLYNMRIVELLDAKGVRQALTLNGTVKDAHVVSFPVRCKTPPGEKPQYRYFEWSSIDLDGKVYITGRDIGEERTHRIEMAKAIHDLEARNADLERFASVAAHQLRSPPRTITGIAQALKEDYGGLLDDEGIQFLDDVRTDADQMAEIVDGLYRFSKVRTSADMHIEPVDLNALLDHIYESKKKRGCWDGPRCLLWDTLPTVLGDKLLLKEVFANLIDNGFKFNESDEKVVAITASRREDGRWVIHVEDNGIGIDPQYQPKLFQMFERVHPKYEGSGVGLALVQAIVNKLGGTVTVESNTGDGATFSFDLEGAWSDSMLTPDPEGA